jgi:hypothetical protein
VCYLSAAVGSISPLSKCPQQTSSGCWVTRSWTVPKVDHQLAQISSLIAGPWKLGACRWGLCPGATDVGARFLSRGSMIQPRLFRNSITVALCITSAQPPLLLFSPSPAFSSSAYKRVVAGPVKDVTLCSPKLSPGGSLAQKVSSCPQRSGTDFWTLRRLMRIKTDLRPQIVHRRRNSSMRSCHGYPRI